MVKWKDLWLTKRDSNDVIIGLWATKKDVNYARCSLCSCDLKYSTQGFKTFTQHSVIKQHKDVSKRSFRENKTKDIFFNFLVKGFASTIIIFNAPFQSKVSAEEAIWAFKVAE